LAVIGSLRCIACVPLTVEQETIGCLMLGRATPFQAEEVRLLTALAEIAGNAIHRAGVMETLEQRVSERTRELGDANERLTELDRLKNEFVSNVSHELRTPITNIILYLDLLENPSREERRLQYMNVLKQEAERLGHLIEDLLTISRMERGALPIDVQPHPLDALLAGVVSAHAARGAARGVSLHHELNPDCPVALVSREQISQVFNNLLANAIAYSPAGTLVDVRSEVRRMAGQAMVGICFRNAGPPIPAEDLPHIFERFYRGQTARVSGESGTGLGLAICQEIVARHAGWFEVESDATQGTAFTVWLPAAEAGRSSPSSPPTNPPPAPSAP
jgi:signal transduction histidine kinase